MAGYATGLLPDSYSITGTKIEHLTFPMQVMAHQKVKTEIKTFLLYVPIILVAVHQLGDFHCA